MQFGNDKDGLGSSTCRRSSVSKERDKLASHPFVRPCVVRTPATLGIESPGWIVVGAQQDLSFVSISRWTAGCAVSWAGEICCKPLHRSLSRRKTGKIFHPLQLADECCGVRPQDSKDSRKRFCRAVPINKLRRIEQDKQWTAPNSLRCHWPSGQLIRNSALPCAEILAARRHLVPVCCTTALLSTRIGGTPREGSCSRILPIAPAVKMVIIFNEKRRRQYLVLACRGAATVRVGAGAGAVVVKRDENDAMLQEN